MTITKKDILNEMQFIESSKQKEIMSFVVDYLLENSHVREFGTSRVTQLLEKSKKECSTHEVLRSLLSLCMLEHPLLELKYSLMLQDGTGLPIDVDEVENARRTGYLEHPETGMMISYADNQENIFMYFKTIRY